MKTKETTVVSPVTETLELVNPKTLVANSYKAKLYQVDNTYHWLLLNVKNFGIREPIIADRKSKMVISGNRRLKAALELGIKEVPVIFRELEEDKNIHKAVFVSHEIQREKTYSQILQEYKILRQKYPPTQGARNDIREGVPDIEMKAILNQISRSTMFYLVRIDDIVRENYPAGESSDTYKRIWKELDSGVSTPSKWYNKLINLGKDKEEKKMLKEDSSFEVFDCRFLNKSCENLIDLQDNSVACFISSPPYWGFDKSYGDVDSNVIGREEKYEDYINRLVKIYKSALPKLKKGGSIWVNLSEAWGDKTYNLVPHRFAIQMMKELDLVVNDEIVWNKSPIYHQGKRGARGFEYIFQFVRRDETRFLYHDTSWLDSANDLRNQISLSGGELIKKPTSFWNFRDGVLETQPSNIKKLKNACKKLNITCDNDGTFPFEVAMIPILTSTSEGELVVDLFGGIGTTALVAGALKRKSVSYEINPEYCKSAHVLLGELITIRESEELTSDKPLTEIISEMDMTLAA
jgi:DNA modification methylase